MRRTLFLVALFACATRLGATRCDVGDWVMLQFNMGPDPKIEGLQQRFAIVGEEQTGTGERLVWLEMVVHNPRYPIIAQILVQDSLFEHSDGSETSFYNATKRFVGTFGNGPVQELPAREARKRMGGYLTFLAGIGAKERPRVVDEEEMAVGDHSLRCLKLDVGRSSPTQVSEGFLWLCDEVPIAGFVRRQMKHTPIDEQGAEMAPRFTEIRTLAFGTGAESSLPGGVLAAVAPISPGGERKPVDDATFAQIEAYYEYDRQLPLDAQVLDTQKYDGRELPYTTDKIRFQSVGDEKVVGYFAYPPDSDQEPCPAVVLLHGHNGFRGSRDRWTSGFLDVLAREGYCALAIDQLGFGERLVPREQLQERDVSLQHAIDARRAIDYLYTRAEVDTARIGLIGESMGGLSSCRVAGLEDRLAAVVLVVAGAWEAAVAPDHPRVWRRHPLNFAPRITAPTLMVNATQDEYTQRDEAEALHDALRVSKRLAWHKSEHSIPVEDQKKDVLKWLDRYLR